MPELQRTEHAFKNMVQPGTLSDLEFKLCGVPMSVADPPSYNMLPAAPDGHAWKSTPINSVCTMHLVCDKRWFQSLWRTNVSITTANGVTEKANEQGAVVLNCYMTTGNCAVLMLHDAVHVPQMHNLISVSRLLNAGVKVVLDDINSHIVLPNGERIHARRENGLFMLGYLVPLCDVKQEYSDDSGAGARAYGVVSKNENSLSGSEPVPAAQVSYPDAIPVLATPVQSSQMLNHLWYGHHIGLQSTKKSIQGLHGDCTPVQQ